MKSDNYFPGAQIEGVIIEFYSPNEFYCSFIEENDYIKLSEADDCSEAPEKSDIVKFKKFMIRVGDENVLCEVINDLKSEDVSCQVLLCNTSVKLKVNYQSLRHLNEKINNDDIVALKLNDFAPIFRHTWSKDLLDRMKEKLLYKRVIVQFKSSKFDPVDGRCPVNLLDVSSGESVTDHFIDEKLASRYGDYYDQWLDYETHRIFECKEKENKKYMISSPMFKKYPTRRHKITSLASHSKHKFNVEAQPFTPNSSKSIKPDTLLLEPLLQSTHIDKNVHTPLIIGRIMTTAPLSPQYSPDISMNGNYHSPSATDSDYCNTSQRIKCGLEVVSPSSKRKITSAVVASISPSYPVDGSERLSHQLGGQQGSPGEDVTSSDDKGSSPPGIDVRDQDYPGDGYGHRNIATQSVLGHSPKKYPFGTLNYQMPFGGSLFAFQPYTLQNMFMYQSSLMRPKLAPEAFFQGSKGAMISDSKVVMSPGDVGPGKFGANEKNL